MPFGSTLNSEQESKLPRSSLQDALQKLARRRLADQSSTSDVHAAFKEGEKSPIAGASL